MKKLSVVLMLLMLFSWSVVTAQETNVKNDVTVQTGQVMKGLGSAESASGASSTSSSTSGPSSASVSGVAGGSSGSISGVDYHPTTNYPEYKPGLPNVNPVGTAWWMPSGDQTAFWNALAADLRFYERSYTRAEVEGILKAYGLPTGKYAKFGKKKGFKWGVALFDYKASPADEVELKLGQIRVVSPEGQVGMMGETPEQIKEKFSFLGDIPVTASKGKLQILTLMLALKLAMDNGVDMVVVNQKMNTVYLGKNISPNGGLGGATTNVSLAAILGLSSTNAKGEGEPVVEFGAFKKNGHAKPPVLTPAKGQSEKDKKKPADKGIEKKVNPDVLKSSENQKEDDWYWGITPSEEVEKRAQMPSNQIMKANLLGR